MHLFDFVLVVMRHFWDVGDGDDDGSSCRNVECVFVVVVQRRNAPPPPQYWNDRNNIFVIDDNEKFTIFRFFWVVTDIDCLTFTLDDKKDATSLVLDRQHKHTKSIDNVMLSNQQTNNKRGV